MFTYLMQDVQVIQDPRCALAQYFQNPNAWVELRRRVGESAMRERSVFSFV